MSLFNSTSCVLQDGDTLWTQTVERVVSPGAYAAVMACLDPKPSDQRDNGCYPNAVILTTQHDRFYALARPAHYWSSVATFEDELTTHVLATKTQLNWDLDQDRAVEDLLVRYLDLLRLSA